MNATLGVNVESTVNKPKTITIGLSGGLREKFKEIFANVSQQRIQFLFEFGFMADVRDCDVREVSAEKVKQFFKNCGPLVNSDSSSKGFTDGQITKLVQLFSKTPTRLIIELLSSGLVSRLSDCDVLKASRDEFRRALGFRSPAFATVYGEVFFTAGYKEQFSLADIISDKEHFVFGENFIERFSDKEELNNENSQIQCLSVSEWPGSKSVVRYFGRNSETTLSEMVAMLIPQKNGIEGYLQVDGTAVHFFIRDKDAVFCIVRCVWKDGKWYICTKEFDGSHKLTVSRLICRK